MSDCLVIGGGVIGLSLAYELAQHMRVRLIDAGVPGQEASWAGAGILPPASATSTDPLEQLTVLSNELHVQWAETLQAETGIDNGFRRCGGLYLARTAVAAKSLLEAAPVWRQGRIAVEELTPSALQEIEPNINVDPRLDAVLLLPDERQIRNPRHLKALLMGCAKRGVDVQSGVAAEDFEIRGGRVDAIRTSTGMLRAGAVCITTGSWSQALISRLGARPTIKPIRGQIALLNCDRPLLKRIVTQGLQYLVPRDDGRVLVGSTQEDVGFDRRTTTEAIAALLQFAVGTVPALRTAQLERCWAGLRPCTPDGLPYLGRAPGLENVYVAAGHFRWGLQLSAATAVVMGQMVRGQQPQVDLHTFRLDRQEPVVPEYASTAVSQVRR